MFPWVFWKTSCLLVKGKPTWDYTWVLLCWRENKQSPIPNNMWSSSSTFLPLSVISIHQATAPIRLKYCPFKKSSKAIISIDENSSIVVWINLKQISLLSNIIISSPWKYRSHKTMTTRRSLVKSHIWHKWGLGTIWLYAVLTSTLWNMRWFWETATRQVTGQVEVAKYDAQCQLPS